jgi:hypothetical protein
MFLGQADSFEVGKQSAHPHDFDQLACAIPGSYNGDGAREELVSIDQRAEAGRVDEFKRSTVKEQVTHILIAEIVDLCIDRSGTSNVQVAAENDEPTTIQLMRCRFQVVEADFH